MTRNQKEELIARLSDEFTTNNAVVVCNYKGIITKQLEVLRDSARVANVKVEVIKNTLASIALEKSGKNGLTLKDTNIYLWGEDALAVTKVAAKFAEKNNAFEVKFGHIDGEVADANKITALSKMPSREELLAMLLQVWNAPIQNFTIGLNALKEKKEQE
ncbi:MULTISPECIES: 50S ribosomal protein L10 [unclassified Campylobacter]|uniref:50S ribosomal protein L10 n=1 Tax=unclassified Campylobacter TaxID=2593542 RepID=UPI001BDAD3B0|nr:MULTISPECIES: 50S ribosomal protein L10 [unclassified Campylobacter]MBZ7976877.1 50S ribosomal protein L10 [Campylobacter sp. RM12637]MBZ7978816.1 50S ribosomal protein L10 [Campylobacter sp. RM12654]MBZ7980530.1 50S ribosomal protein L10 [Campylobacter sp. RM12642]MBZ7982338.1 50S ribosomal protein L10 [Campylobacter sp. RM12640]MBZ7984125.1 50S ribosomal protein L10 [Campylobacter sp. RM12647]MBZ7989717.1 50S ribosomal protein L10 [Campylobacter sp. RM12635]MBZ7991529.1 50S ribosomal pr